MVALAIGVSSVFPAALEGQTLEQTVRLMIYTNLRNLLVESWDFLPIFHDGTSTK